AGPDGPDAVGDGERGRGASGARGGGPAAVSPPEGSAPPPWEELPPDFFADLEELPPDAPPPPDAEAVETWTDGLPPDPAGLPPGPAGGPPSRDRPAPAAGGSALATVRELFPGRVLHVEPYATDGEEQAGQAEGPHPEPWDENGAGWDPEEE